MGIVDGHVHLSDALHLSMSTIMCKFAKHIFRMMKDYDAYIFDLDGTLLDTLGDLAASVNHALRLHGLPEHNMDDIRRFVGNGVGKLVERAVPDGTASSMFAAVLDDFKAYYSQHNMDLTVPYPGIMDMLGRLRRKGKRMAVVSNKFDAATKSLCRHFFHGYIDVAIGESEGVRRKPAPDTVVEALRQLYGSDIRKSPSAPRIVYIGDSDVDIATAQNSGLPCVSVLWGFRDKAFLAAHGAETFIASADEIG